MKIPPATGALHYLIVAHAWLRTMPSHKEARHLFYLVYSLFLNLWLACFYEHLHENKVVDTERDTQTRKHPKALIVR